MSNADSFFHKTPTLRALWNNEKTDIYGWEVASE